MKEISFHEAKILLKKLGLSDKEFTVSIDPDVLVDLVLKSESNNTAVTDIDEVSTDPDQGFEVAMNNVCRVFGNIGKQMVYNGTVPGIKAKRDGSGKCTVEFDELSKYYPPVSAKHLLSGEQVYYRAKPWAQKTGKKLKTLYNKPSTTKVGNLRLYASSML